MDFAFAPVLRLFSFGGLRVLLWMDPYEAPEYSDMELLVYLGFGMSRYPSKSPKRR